MRTFNPSPLWRQFGIFFLLTEAVGAAAWWLLLLLWPETRTHFLAQGAPDVTLLAFAIADGIFFIGSAAISAHGLRKGTAWAWPLLCIHAGAATYAALYCWTLVALTAGDGVMGAVLMTPSLIFPGLRVWHLRPAN